MDSLLSSAAWSYATVSYFPDLSVRNSYGWTFTTFFILFFTAKIVYYVILYPVFFTPYKHLPTPLGRSFWNGQFKALTSRPQGVPYKEWCRDLPNDGLIRTYITLNSERLVPTSPKAWADLMVHRAYDWEKTRWIFLVLRQFTGVGLLLAEGDVHKAQRKNFNPAFAYRHVKELYPLFWSKSVEMVRGIERATKPLSDGTLPVTIQEWSGRATLDIIGLASIGIDFNSVGDPNNELYLQYKQMGKAEPRFIGILKLIFLNFWPKLVDYFPFESSRKKRAASRNVRSISRQLIRKKMSQLKKEDGASNDIISVALERCEYSEDEVIDQAMTFLAAGHDTTSTSLQYAAFAMSKEPDIQERLREEIRTNLPPISGEGTTTGDGISAALLDSLPYLNAVCNELLRFYPPVPVTVRQASRDTYILNEPVKKGTIVSIPILGMNHSTELWGPDAEEFNPERWMGPGRAKMGGAESNYALSTFIHGPRSCIGSGFARGEFLCLVAAMVGRFKIELEDPDKEMEYKIGITVCPRDGVRAKLTPLEGW